MLATQALAQHEGVLRTDRHDQRQAQAKSRDGNDDDGHGADARRTASRRRTNVLQEALAWLLMKLDLAQLRALSTAVSEGTFEAAARHLHVTPSAISQRIKALENATGRVLLQRTTPVQPTESGRVVLRLAQQVEHLTAETAHELGAEQATARPSTLSIAVNADSLGTWVLPALAPLAAQGCFDLHREDQEHTTALLRNGVVMAAITADAEPVPGCSSTRLGNMRYRPMAAPGFADRWLPDNRTADALAQAPVVVFDREDDLQHHYLRRRATTQPRPDPPTHHVPSTADFLTAVRLGLGWGMLPDLQTTELEDSGELVDLDPTGPVDVTLHWQQWKLRSVFLDSVATAIHTAAKTHLHQ